LFVFERHRRLEFLSYLSSSLVLFSRRLPDVQLWLEDDAAASAAGLREKWPRDVEETGFSYQV
jgi:hypothetical protein